jgi:glutamate--cysteine ligase
MTAQQLITGSPRASEQATDPLASPATAVETARAHVAGAALTPDEGGRVGLELEYHLIDLADPGRRPTWQEVVALGTELPPLPSKSPVTFEPGGQVELSTPPGDDVVSAVAALRADGAALRSALRVAGYGAVPLGSDLARPVRRTNPHPRYSAMELHFDALGCAGSGQAMMTATAALQVNLDAGAREGWAAQPGHLAGDRPRTQRPPSAGRADRGVGDVRPRCAGDAGPRR